MFLLESENEEMVFGHESYVGVGFVKKECMGAIGGVVDTDSAGVFGKGKEIADLEKGDLDVLLNGGGIFGRS